MHNITELVLDMTYGLAEKRWQQQYDKRHTFSVY